MASGTEFKLECACKRIALNVKGIPAFQVWCHCSDCRKWNQTTPVGIAIFPEEAFLELEGGESIQKHILRNKEMNRAFCKGCGYRLYNQHRGFAFRGTPAINLEGFTFAPQAHVFCKDASPEALARYKEDGLPKFEDQPPVAGGTGKQIEI